MSSNEPGNTSDAAAPFTVSRVFQAPRALVWTVYTDPNHLAKWFGPEGTEVLKSKMDLRVGGTYHYGMRMPDGNEMWGRQSYRDIVPKEKLVYLQAFSDKDGGATRHPASPTWPLEMLATTTFESVDERTTRIAITWVPFESSAEECATFDQARDGMTGGFKNMLDLLDGYLATLAG